MTHQQTCKDFFKKQKSLMLSTLNASGVLETSVAPFVFRDNCFYIFVSELAQHTQNLLWLIEHNKRNSTNPPGLVSALLVADESTTEQLFARERITLQLAVSEVYKNDSEYEAVLDMFAETFGEVIDVLKTLPDFHLIALKVQKGGYVKGFGQAYLFDGSVCEGLIAISK